MSSEIIEVYYAYPSPPHPTPPPSLGFSWFREVGFLKCLLTRSFSLEKKSFYMLLYWIKNLFLAHQNVSRDHKFNKLESTIHVRNIIIYSCIVLNFWIFFLFLLIFTTYTFVSWLNFESFFCRHVASFMKVGGAVLF